MNLEEYINDYKIFIDTCSLLQSLRHTETFFTVNKALLLSHKQKINIPLRVIQEIERHSHNESKYLLMRIANQVYKKLVLWQKQGLVEICGDNQTDNFADNAFLTAFTSLRVHSKLLLITQDKKLAHDILALNGSLSVRGHDIKVLKFDRLGRLVPFKFFNDNKITKEKTSSKIVTTAMPKPQANKLNLNDINPPKPKAEEIFATATKITSLADNAIKLNNVLTVGETVYDEKRCPILLKAELGAGGEGSIYSTNTDLVAKIYKSGKLTCRKQAKLKLLISKGLAYPGICFPTSALYNNNGEFVGYLMPAAQGVDLQRSIFNRKLFEKKFPDWKKQDLVQLALTILVKFKYLHDRNIIIGDINPFNILVVSPAEVYFVDTDSYQIAEYPCPVGTAAFTPVELQGKSYEDYLRSKGNENFAIATMLFMLMVPGKFPYAHQGGKSIVDNIRKQKFSYQLGHIKGEKVPEGLWRFIWSHLSYQVKEAFYETFQKGGKYSYETSRLGVDTWLQLFKDYYVSLTNGKMLKNDAMSNDLFPTRFKKERWAIYKPCQICGRETKKEFGQNTVVCYECSQQVYEKRICTKCGQEFTITQGEKIFLEEKGIALPVNCKPCRNKNKFKFKSRFF